MRKKEETMEVVMLCVPTEMLKGSRHPGGICAGDVC